MTAKKTSTKIKKSTATPAKIEDNLSQLQKLVDKLERGKDNLDSAMQDYEQGIKLIQVCKQQLEAAEQKVEILTAENEFIEYEREDDDD